MRDIILITTGSIRNNLKSKALTVVFVSITLMIVAGLALFFCLLLITPAMNDSVPDRTQLELYLSLIMYTTSLICSGINLNVFAFQSMTKEKSRGNIESLMATPLSPKEIWIGKSIAIFLPGYAISIISTLIILSAVNFFVIIPATGNFILPAPLLLISFLINPLLFLALLLFIVLFSLANNPDIAIAPSFLVGFGLMIGIPLGVATGVINLVSWSFTLWCLAGVIIFWAADFGLYRLLTKENIVLSSKGA